MRIIFKKPKPKKEPPVVRDPDTYEILLDWNTLEDELRKAGLL